MFRLPIYQVDAFTRRVFGGNPAALVPLTRPLDDVTLQAIALENNLSETAFFGPTHGTETDYWLRWFTPACEIDLCGHATLATAWLLLEHLNTHSDHVRFSSRSGTLVARRHDDGITIDLPARASETIAPDAALATALGATPRELRRGANLIAIFDSAETVRALTPDMHALARFHPLGVIATAPGEEVDVVSRYFAPSFGIDEDPVTGSAHCDLAPYWCPRLGKADFRARQLSARGGELTVRLDGERVHLSGQCQLYLSGEIRIPGS